MPSPLPRQVRWSLFARLSPSTAAFPVKKSGRLLQLFFRGLLSVHSRYGLHARRVAKRPSTSKAPTASLPPLPLRLLPGGATSSRAGFTPAEVQRLFTAHFFANYAPTLSLRIADCLLGIRRTWSPTPGRSAHFMLQPPMAGPLLPESEATR